MGAYAAGHEALVGRGRELARLDAVLARAVAGRSETVVVTGDIGVGKTALVRAMMRRAAGRGIRVLGAVGLEGECELPFATLHALLTPVLGEPAARDALGETALAPVLGRGSGPLSVLATAQAVLSLISGLGARRPTVVVIDDAQWADPASLQALLFTAHRLDADRVAVVLVQRAGGRGPLDGLAFERIELAGLDGAATAELLAGDGVAGAVARRCGERAGGNPLALLEGVAALSADQRAGRAPLPAVWPLGGRLHGHVAARLRGLPGPTRLALAVLALEPTGDRRVIDDAVRRLGGDPAALAAAEEAGIVRAEGATVVFSHPLMAVAAGLDPAPDRRREIHRALAATDPARLHPDRIVGHLARSASGPDEALAARLEEIGRRRTDQGAYESAANAYHRAAELSVEPLVAGRRLVLGADRLVSAALMEDVIVRLTPLVDTVEDPVLAADLAAVLGQAELWHVGALAATRRFEGQAARVRHESPRRSAVLLLHAVAAHILGLVPEAAHATAGRIVALLESDRGEPDAYLLAARGVEVICAALAAARLPAPGELEGIGEFLLALMDAGSSDASALLHLCAQAMLTGDGHEGALGLAERSLAQAQRSGIWGREMLSRLLRADCLWRTGRWSESLAEVSLVTSVDQAVGRNKISSLALGQLARVEAGLGMGESCRRHAQGAIEAAGRHGLPTVEAWARCALGLLALGEGDCAGAADELERLAVVVAGVHQPGWLWWQADAVEALHGAGHGHRARAQLDRLAEEAARTRSRWAAAAVERCRAVLGLVDPVPACTRALEGFRAVGAGFEEARTLLARGELRQQAGDEGGIADLRTAAARFDRLGATSWRARAARSIDGFEAEPPLSARLTAAELRVALAVSRGSTNRQAAEQLYLSVKTVDFHLQAIYRKLGLRRRTQLVAMVAAASPP
jgi:DNA-binding CsgD family transcriptional regulator